VPGVANMSALGSVISWQKLDYDFQFHQQPFHTDIAVLVLSEGKSMLKVCVLGYFYMMIVSWSVLCFGILNLRCPWVGLAPGLF